MTISYKRDIQLLLKIIRHADELADALEKLAADKEKFLANNIESNVIRKSTAMDILQIGELANQLSNDLKMKYKSQPWNEIVALRNRAAHGYETIDFDMIWDIADSNIPDLKTFCENVLQTEHNLTTNKQENNDE